MNTQSTANLLKATAVASVLCVDSSASVNEDTEKNALDATSAVYYIYQDADFSRHSESADSIKKGIELAFDEIDNQIHGHQIKFKYLDHRGKVNLSKKNYEAFAEDPEALVVFSGMHSPPLIKNRAFINESKALTLVPWAAGGPITRYPDEENWIFRLSIDDTRAAPVILNYAIEQKGCSSPALFLEKTPWGDGNLRTMWNHLEDRGISNVKVRRFDWNTQEKGATALLGDAIDSGSNCVVFVGNAIEGATFAQAMINLPQEKRVPIVSHWGITGGDFHVEINHLDREQVDISFIQSCFAFTDPEGQSEFSRDVFQRLSKKYPEEIREAGDIKSAVGLIHAYDLSRLLIQAIHEAKLTGDTKEDRNAIRVALENLQSEVQGLVKTYRRPFSVFNADTAPNAHEALDPESFCMAKYGSDNEIVLVSH